MTAEYIAWVIRWVTATAALTFIWHGKVGTQVVLMPGYPFEWWMDAPEIYEGREGEDRGTGERLVN